MQLYVGFISVNVLLTHTRSSVIFVHWSFALEILKDLSSKTVALLNETVSWYISVKCFKIVHKLNSKEIMGRQLKLSTLLWYILWEHKCL
jgi:hypothetical protein